MSNAIKNFTKKLNYIFFFTFDHIETIKAGSHKRVNIKWKKSAEEEKIKFYFEINFSVSLFLLELSRAAFVVYPTDI